MAKTIKVKRGLLDLPPNPDPDPEPFEWLLSTGETVEEGELLLVRHHSFGGRWLELPLKRVSKTKSGLLNYHFFHSPPGSLTVDEDNVKKPKPKKRIKITKTKKED